MNEPKFISESRHEKLSEKVSRLKAEVRELKRDVSALQIAVNHLTDMTHPRKK